MPFLKQSDYKTVMQAKKDGDPKAIELISAYVKGCSQHDLDTMLHAFYNPSPANDAEELEENPKNEPAVEAVEETEAEIEQAQPVIEEPEPMSVGIPSEEIPDISAQLDADLDGLIDEDEIMDGSFEDFLAEKKKNANRLSKGADYFKMYDPAGRASYLMSKCDAYNKSFDTKRKDIDRAFRDMDDAVACYSKSISELPDDGMELDSSVTNDAYSEIVDASKGSHAFGRAWDDDDTAEMVGLLSALVGKYGKANVSAALNVIRGDNEAFRDRRNGQIDSAVRHYSRQLEDLLK